MRAPLLGLLLVACRCASGRLIGRASVVLLARCGRVRCLRPLLLLAAAGWWRFRVAAARLLLLRLLGRSGSAFGFGGRFAPEPFEGFECSTICSPIVRAYWRAYRARTPHLQRSAERAALQVQWIVPVYEISHKFLSGRALVYVVYFPL